MGSASFRNCVLTKIPKSWPTFSSGDILRNVLSTHFCPALSTWIGRGCRKRSLLLSLAKQHAASESVISSRCRSMELTIAEIGGVSGVGSSHVRRAPQSSSGAANRYGRRAFTTRRAPFDGAAVFEAGRHSGQQARTLHPSLCLASDKRDLGSSRPDTHSTGS